jgi:hypothetical protein
LVQSGNISARCDIFAAPGHRLEPIEQQNLKLYRSLVAASEAAAAKADARQEKLLKGLAEEVANEPPPKKS